MYSKLLVPAKKLITKAVGIDFSYVDRIYDAEREECIKRWVLLLPGAGCTWARKTGGCYMCGFSNKSIEVNPQANPDSKKIAWAYTLGKIIVKGERPSNLTIYNGGSFLNDTEISHKMQLEICREVADHPSIDKLFVESRPEFVTPQKIKLLQDNLKDKTLEVGIGLECQSDEIRKNSIHKGFTKKEYERAVEVLKKANAKILTYIFLKPPFVTELEAIEEAIKSIGYAFNVGSDEVAMQSAFVQQGTLMAKLYQNNQFRPPWLWSIIEVVKKTSHLGPVYIGKFEDEPPPIAIPHNCPKCSPVVSQKLEHYRQHHNLERLRGLHCDCKKEWRQVIKKIKA